ncbi:MAG: hypothetical protein KC466_01355 [Myxococcales bacterium]|nr:hypothetical protein [Myxococcales bacterium]
MSRWVHVASIATAAVALALAAGGCPPPQPTCDPAFAPAHVDGFVWGVSQGPTSLSPLAADLGFEWKRLTMGWRTLEPVVTQQNLTRADVDADPSLIDDFLATANWAPYDAAIADITAAGMQPIAIIGHGYASTLPDFNGERLNPDTLGKENYIGHQYLITRAAVARYNGDGDRDAPGGQVIKFWQLENELNQAMLTTLFTWREPIGLDGLTSAWADWQFLTDLLTALGDAVKTEDPDAVTTMNFHTDVHPNINALLNTPSWQASIIDWRELVDVVSFDAYPNYYKAAPTLGSVVGERTTEIKALACPGQQVMIMETGYPTGPAIRDFDEAGQAAFIQDAVDTSVAAGAEGFLLFGLKTAETHSVEITQEDLDNLVFLGNAYDQGDAAGLLNFALQNLEYLQGHFNEVLQSVEGYWGLVHADDTPKTAYATVQAISASLP